MTATSTGWPSGSSRPPERARSAMARSGSYPWRRRGVSVQERPAATHSRSCHPPPRGPGLIAPENLRAARARVVDDVSLGGAAFGRALTEVVDDAFDEMLAGIEPGGRWCLVALGSYARGELCPGSDLDVMFLTDGQGLLDRARGLTEHETGVPERVP